jgi:hypothetical protein
MKDYSNLRVPSSMTLSVWSMWSGSYVMAATLTSAIFDPIRVTVRY